MVRREIAEGDRRMNGVASGFIAGCVMVGVGLQFGWNYIMFFGGVLLALSMITAALEEGA